MRNVPARLRIRLSGPIAAAKKLWLAAFAGRRKAATLTAAALALAVGYHVVFGANGLTVYMQKRAEHRALRQQAADLQRENDETQQHVDRLRSDPDAIEHQAREQLHYAKPGEVIYTMPVNPAPDAAGGDPGNPAKSGN